LIFRLLFSLTKVCQVKDKVIIAKTLLIILNLSKSNGDKSITPYYLIDFEQYEDLLCAILHRTQVILIKFLSPN